MALGTFYNYFTTRQELLDQILPTLGDEMLEFIRLRVSDVADPVDRERAQFRAFFDFLIERPEFFRVLHEAEQFAPEAFRLHHAKVEASYVKWLARLRADGALADFDADELTGVARILMAARDYISTLYALSDGKKATPIPEEVAAAYMKLVTHGLFAGSATKSPPARRTARKRPR